MVCFVPRDWQFDAWPDATHGMRAATIRHPAGCRNKVRAPDGKAGDPRRAADGGIVDGLPVVVCATTTPTTGVYTAEAGAKGGTRPSVAHSPGTPCHCPGAGAAERGHAGSGASGYDRNAPLSCR